MDDENHDASSSIPTADVSSTSSQAISSGATSAAVTPPVAALHVLTTVPPVQHRSDLTPTDGYAGVHPPDDDPPLPSPPPALSPPAAGGLVADESPVIAPPTPSSAAAADRAAAGGGGSSVRLSSDGKRRSRKRVQLSERLEEFAGPVVDEVVIRGDDHSPPRAMMMEGGSDSDDSFNLTEVETFQIDDIMSASPSASMHRLVRRTERRVSAALMGDDVGSASPAEGSFAGSMRANSLRRRSLESVDTAEESAARNRQRLEVSTKASEAAARLDIGTALSRLAVAWQLSVDSQEPHPSRLATLLPPLKAVRNAIAYRRVAADVTARCYEVIGNVLWDALVAGASEITRALRQTPEAYAVLASFVVEAGHAVREAAGTAGAASPPTSASAACLVDAIQSLVGVVIPRTADRVATEAAGGESGRALLLDEALPCIIDAAAEVFFFHASAVGGADAAERAISAAVTCTTALLSPTATVSGDEGAAVWPPMIRLLDACCRAEVGVSAHIVCYVAWPLVTGNLCWAGHAGICRLTRAARADTVSYLDRFAATVFDPSERGGGDSESHHMASITHQSGTVRRAVVSVEFVECLLRCLFGRSQQAGSSGAAAAEEEELDCRQAAASVLWSMCQEETRQQRGNLGGDLDVAGEGGSAQDAVHLMVASSSWGEPLQQAADLLAPKRNDDDDDRASIGRHWWWVSDAVAAALLQPQGACEPRCPPHDGGEHPRNGLNRPSSSWFDGLTAMAMDGRLPLSAALMQSPPPASTTATTTRADRSRPRRRLSLSAATTQANSPATGAASGGRSGGEWAASLLSTMHDHYYTAQEESASRCVRSRGKEQTISFTAAAFMTTVVLTPTKRAMARWVQRHLGLLGATRRDDASAFHEEQFACVADALRLGADRVIRSRQEAALLDVNWDGLVAGFVEALTVAVVSLDVVRAMPVAALTSGSPSVMTAMGAGRRCIPDAVDWIASGLFPCVSSTHASDEPPPIQFGPLASLAAVNAVHYVIAAVVVLDNAPSADEVPPHMRDVGNNGGALLGDVVRKLAAELPLPPDAEATALSAARSGLLPALTWLALAYAQDALSHIAAVGGANKPLPSLRRPAATLLGRRRSSVTDRPIGVGSGGSAEFDLLVSTAAARATEMVGRLHSASANPTEALWHGALVCADTALAARRVLLQSPTTPRSDVDAILAVVRGVSQLTASLLAGAALQSAARSASTPLRRSPAVAFVLTGVQWAIVAGVLETLDSWMVDSTATLGAQQKCFRAACALLAFAPSVHDVLFVKAPVRLCRAALRLAAKVSQTDAWDVLSHVAVALSLPLLPPLDGRASPQLGDDSPPLAQQEEGTAATWLGGLAQQGVGDWFLLLLRTMRMAQGDVAGPSGQTGQPVLLGAAALRRPSSSSFVGATAVSPASSAAPTITVPPALSLLIAWLLADLGVGGPAASDSDEASARLVAQRSYRRELRSQGDAALVFQIATEASTLDAARPPSSSDHYATFCCGKADLFVFWPTTSPRRPLGNICISSRVSALMQAHVRQFWTEAEGEAVEARDALQGLNELVRKSWQRERDAEMKAVVAMEAVERAAACQGVETALRTAMETLHEHFRSAVLQTEAKAAAVSHVHTATDGSGEQTQAHTQTDPAEEELDGGGPKAAPPRLHSSSSDVGSQTDEIISNEVSSNRAAASVQSSDAALQGVPASPLAPASAGSVVQHPAASSSSSAFDVMPVPPIAGLCACRSDAAAQTFQPFAIAAGCQVPPDGMEREAAAMLLSLAQEEVEARDKGVSTPEYEHRLALLQAASAQIVQRLREDADAAMERTTRAFQEEAAAVAAEARMQADRGAARAHSQAEARVAAMNALHRLIEIESASRGALERAYLLRDGGDVPSETHSELSWAGILHRHGLNALQLLLQRQTDRGAVVQSRLNDAVAESRSLRLECQLGAVGLGEAVARRELVQCEAAAFGRGVLAMAASARMGHICKQQMALQGLHRSLLGAQTVALAATEASGRLQLEETALIHGALTTKKCNDGTALQTLHGNEEPPDDDRASRRVTTATADAIAAHYATERRLLQQRDAHASAQRASWQAARIVCAELEPPFRAQLTAQWGDGVAQLQLQHEERWNRLRKRRDAALKDDERKRRARLLSSTADAGKPNPTTTGSGNHEEAAAMAPSAIECDATAVPLESVAFWRRRTEMLLDDVRYFIGRLHAGGVRSMLLDSDEQWIRSALATFPARKEHKEDSAVDDSLVRERLQWAGEADTSTGGGPPPTTTDGSSVLPTRDDHHRRHLPPALRHEGEDEPTAAAVTAAEPRRRVLDDEPVPAASAPFVVCGEGCGRVSHHKSMSPGRAARTAGDAGSRPLVDHADSSASAPSSRRRPTSAAGLRQALVRASTWRDSSSEADATAAGVKRPPSEAAGRVQVHRRQVAALSDSFASADGPAALKPASSPPLARTLASATAAPATQSGPLPFHVGCYDSLLDPHLSTYFRLKFRRAAATLREVPPTDVDD